MREYSGYRDGGTMSIRGMGIKYICKSDIDEVCIDYRIGCEESHGTFWLGYPEKEGSRRLTQGEIDEIFPMIKKNISDDIKWRKAYLTKLEEIK